MKIIAKLILTFLVFSLLGAPKTVLAQYCCHEERSVSIDKKVRGISMDHYYDNLDEGTIRFKNGDLIEFSIRVENTGPIDLNNIEVRDILPTGLDLKLYDGQFNQVENKIVWRIDRLTPTESRSFTVRAQIKEADKFPGQYTNIAEVTSDNSIGDRDTASYYAGANGTTLVQRVIPKTGSGLIFGSLAALVTIGGAIALRKWSRGY